MNIKHYIFFTLFLVLLSCSNSTKLSTTNLTNIYEHKEKKFNPEFFIHHNTDSSSALYFRFNSTQLQYIVTDANKPPQAKIKIKYTLYNSFESETILDSLTYYLIEDKSAQQPNFITGKINIKAKRGNNYVLRIISTDIFGSKQAEQFIDINKLDLLSHQNYLITDTLGNPIFGKYINQSQDILVHFHHLRFKELRIRYYYEDFRLAPPPFASYTPKPFNYETDYTLSVALENDVARIKMPKKGFMHIVADKTSRDGLTLFTFPEFFPAFGTSDRMVEPLRYITSKKEYQELLNSPNTKLAVENFWIENATTPERARELIKYFYNRVEYANIYFSSYVEGWKTDRGMAYLIFGPPNAIYKTSTTESWVYGEDNNYMSVNFVFTKVINPFTDNDYRLNRSSIYKSHWYRAVDSWRQGRVFLNN